MIHYNKNKHFNFVSVATYKPSLNLQDMRTKQQQALRDMPGFTADGSTARAWLAMQEDRDKGWGEVRALRKELRRLVVVTRRVRAARKIRLAHMQEIYACSNTGDGISVSCIPNMIMQLIALCT